MRREQHFRARLSAIAALERMQAAHTADAQFIGERAPSLGNNVADRVFVSRKPGRGERLFEMRE